MGDVTSQRQRAEGVYSDWLVLIELFSIHSFPVVIFVFVIHYFSCLLEE